MPYLPSYRESKSRIVRHCAYSYLQGFFGGFCFSTSERVRIESQVILAIIIMYSLRLECGRNVEISPCGKIATLRNGPSGSESVTLLDKVMRRA